MDLTTTKESSIFLWKTNEKLWRGVEKACNKTSAGRLLAFPVSVAEDVVNLTRLTACFGEKAFKGVANISAAPYCKNAKVWTGVKQLLSLIPGVSIFFLPVWIIVRNLVTQTLLLARGASYAREEADDYQRLYTNAMMNIQLNAAARWQANQAQQITQQNPSSSVNQSTQQN